MRKTIFHLLLAGAVLSAGPVCAQNYLGAGRAGVNAVISQKISSLPTPIKNQKELLSILKKKPKLLPKTPVQRTALQRKLQQAVSLPQPEADSHIFKAVVDIDPDTRFSGTVFSTVYQGKKEIYGAIATHTIPAEENDPFGLFKHFTVIIHRPGQPPLKTKAEVVAFSPVSMLDIALVKFPAEVEPLLKPFSLGSTELGETLHSVGYNHWSFTAVSGREVIQKTPSSIRTTMPLERIKRTGLCGSAVLNKENKLVAIHTGSTFQPGNFLTGCSFATPANYLNFLVEAYHQQGRAQIPFFINEKQFFALNVDEYVLSVALLDKQHEVLAQQQLSFRFSHSKLNKMLEHHPQARYLRVITRQVKWNEDGTALLVNRDWPDDSQKTYLYDLQHNTLVTAPLE